jgi:sec-independent protein translocase protein TatB
MFDFAWSEIALIAAVALIAIGPKDMPVAIRAVTDVIKKARRMAGEFQTHVDDMLREANLDEVRGHINDIRNFDVRGAIEKTMDPDGTLRDTFNSNPLEPAAPVVATPAVEEVAVSEPVVAELEKPADAVRPDTPAFIPPNVAPPVTMCTGKSLVEPEAPPFIPPEVVLERRSRSQA